jgi:hypothetical protein
MISKIIALSAEMLREYGSIIGNRSCQDFDVDGFDLPSKYFTESERDDINKKYEDYNSGGEDYEKGSNQLDDGMVCAFAMSVMLESINPKIKMTNALPAGAGIYYWSDGAIDEIEIVEAYSFRGELFVDRIESGIFSVGKLGGYWAKVDQSQFELEG